MFADSYVRHADHYPFIHELNHLAIPVFLLNNVHAGKSSSREMVSVLKFESIGAVKCNATAVLFRS